MNDGFCPAREDDRIDARADRFDQETMGHLERAAASQLIPSDPERATHWLMGRATEETLPFHLQGIAQQWAPTAPNAAATWLGRLPQGPQNDLAFAALAEVILDDDPESAAHWASSVSDANLREKTLANIIRNWKRIDPGAAKAFEPDVQRNSDL